MTDTFTDSSSDRNPSNRFFGCLTHAQDVDDSWGCGLSYPCGIIVLSILIGISAVYHVVYMIRIMSYLYFLNFFTFMIILRTLSDIITIVGIIFAYQSICNSIYKKAVYAYYCLMVSFIIDVIFAIYITIIYIFYSSYYRVDILAFISWLIDAFIFYLFVWFLFAHSVVLKRKNQGGMNINFI